MIRVEFEKHFSAWALHHLSRQAIVFAGQHLVYQGLYNVPAGGPVQASFNCLRLRSQVTPAMALNSRLPKSACAVYRSQQTQAIEQCWGKWKRTCCMRAELCRSRGCRVGVVTSSRAGLLCCHGSRSSYGSIYARRRWAMSVETNAANRQLDSSLLGDALDVSAR